MQELSNLLKLGATDLGITEEQYTDLKAIQTFQETEAYISTAVYDFSTVTESSGMTGTGRFPKFNIWSTDLFIAGNFYYADCHSGRGILFYPCPKKPVIIRNLFFRVLMS